MYSTPPTNFYQSFDENIKGRDFITTDLHGCYDEFMAFLSYLSFDPEVDRMFSCGDLVDRGPKSWECLHLLDNPWFYSVRGNHEQMMIEGVLKKRGNDTWGMNGGDWGMPRSPEMRQEIASYVKLIEPYLPYIIVVGSGLNRFNIVHAEFTFGRNISDEDIDTLEFDEYRSESLIWGRDIISGYGASHSEDLSITYVGHTPLLESVSIGKQRYLDGGIVFNKMLHVVEHKTKTLHTYSKKTNSYSQTTI